MNNLNKIKDELREVAPELLNHNLNLGHHTPEGYFDLLPEIVLVRKDQDISELFIKQGYFDKMQDEVMDKIKPPASRLPRIIPLIRTLSVAASIILLFAVGYLMLNQGSTPLNAQIAMEISTDDALAYLDFNIDDLDINTLIENGMLEGDFLTDEDINLDDIEINNILDEIEDLEIQELEDLI